LTPKGLALLRFTFPARHPSEPFENPKRTLWGKIFFGMT
jgi:hypothetical protein